MFQTTMQDFNKLSLLKRIQEKEAQGWEVERKVYKKVTRLKYATVWAVDMRKEQ